MAATPVNNARPGRRAARWISRADSASGGTGFPVSGMNAIIAAASRVSSVPPIHAAAKPFQSSSSCPTPGPSAMPRYAATEEKLNASPVRPGGARSASAAKPATKNRDSATPRMSLTPTSIQSSVTTRCVAIKTVNKLTPTNINRRRPRRSTIRPTNGRTITVVALKAPRASPRPASPEPSGPVTKNGVTPISKPDAVK